MECHKLRYLNPFYVVPRALSADLKRCNLGAIIERIMLSVSNAFLMLKLGAGTLFFSKFTYLQTVGLLSSATFIGGCFSLGLIWLIQKETNPTGFKGYEIYMYHKSPAKPPGAQGMIVDCVSDLHGFTPPRKKGDLLIVAGDLTARDLQEEHFFMWNYLSNLNYKKIVVIAGNHDNFIQTTNGSKLITQQNPRFKYLQDSGEDFLGFKFWGSPWTKTFEGMSPNCKAFTVNTEEQLAEKWALIPDKTDILVTHVPPYGILDQITHPISKRIENTGSISLRQKIEYLKPKLHVFGHIHEESGTMLFKHIGPNTICVNASLVNQKYQLANKPKRFILQNSK